MACPPHRRSRGATWQACKSEEEARIAAERKAEESSIQLSVERSNHMKLQKMLNLEKTQHAAAKERLKANFGANSDGAMDVSDMAGAPKMVAPPPVAAAGSVSSAELDEANAKVEQFKSKLHHVESERERDKHKLQRTVDAAQLKRREWEREKQSLKRQLENHEAEVRKRDKWLDKAKDIIKEYQKRHAPGGTPQK